MLELNEDSEYLQYDSDHENRESIATVSTSLLNYHTEDSDPCAIYKVEMEEFSDTEIIFMFDGEQSEGESDKLSQVAKTEDHETENESSDQEGFENRVYLEYAESENESVGSELQSNSIIETSSISESEEPDPEELKSLVESYKIPKFPHCDVCDIVFRTLEQLNEHGSIIHDSQEIVTCEVCKNIIHKDFYNIHLMIHRELYNQRLATKYQKSECTVCGKYVSKRYMKIHLLQHGTEEEKAKRSKKCTICNASILASYLTDHMKRVHKQHKEQRNADKPILKIKCPVCCRMFRENTYNSHVASHARTQKKYVCEECGREFFSKSTFATHSLIHKDEYKFKCQFCPYQGKHLGLLKVHVRTHTKDYLYKCTTCDASFITKSNLNAHQKVHSPKVMFICSECGKCFSKEKTLQGHVVSIHEGIKAFVCNLCGKKYGAKVTMAAHKKIIHNVAGPSRVGQTPSYLLRAQGNGTEDGS